MRDSDALLQHMHETASPDGAYGQNLAVTGGILGWLPERVSGALQALVKDGKVEATHPGEDPKKIFGSSWRVVDMPTAAGDESDLDGMTVKQLRAFAKANDIDLEDATAKPDIRAAIDLHLEERDA